MKFGAGKNYVTVETAHSIKIVVTIIIIIIIIIIIFIIINIIFITNTITITIQALACCKWQMFLSQRASIHMTELAC